MAPSDAGQHDDSYGIKKSFLIKSRVTTVVSYSDDNSPSNVEISADFFADFFARIGVMCLCKSVNDTLKLNLL